MREGDANVGRLCALLAISLMSCSNEDHRALSPEGEWVSNIGFTITLDENDSYRLCLEKRCERGKALRPYGSNSPAVILKDVASSSLGQHLFKILFLADGQSSILRENYPDLDFTTNMNIAASQTIDAVCSGEPCFYVGSVENISEGVYFYKS